MPNVNPHPVPVRSERSCFQCSARYFSFRTKWSDHICPTCRTTVPVREKELLAGKPLNTRELQIVRLVAQGLTTKEIAKALCLTGGTVKVYLSRALMKTGCEDRLNLAIRVLKGEIPQLVEPVEPEQEEEESAADLPLAA